MQCLDNFIPRGRVEIVPRWRIEPVGVKKDFLNGGGEVFLCQNLWEIVDKDGASLEADPLEFFLESEFEKCSGCPRKSLFVDPRFGRFMEVVFGAQKRG